MLPPALPDKDADRLKLLAVFHYVLAGAGLLWLGFLGVHYMVMSSIFSHPEMWNHAGKGGPPPPREILLIMRMFYMMGAILIVAGSVLNVIAGRSLQQRRRRIFWLVIAGLNCLQMPLGTVLGIFLPGSPGPKSALGAS